MKRPSPARIVIAASSLTLVGMAVGATDVGAAAGSYSATVEFFNQSGDRVAEAAATPVAAVVRITNTSSSPTALVGSANVTLPVGFNVCPATTAGCAAPSTDTTGFTAVWSSRTLQVRSNSTTSLAKSATLSVTAWVAPTACTLTAWPTEVRPSHNFSGSSSTDYSGGPAGVLGYLAFTTGPPGLTQYDVNMSPAPVATSYNACGTAVTPPSDVQLSDALATLTGGTLRTSGPGTGDTTFSSIQFGSGAIDQSDTLVASGTGFTSATSGAFTVAEKVQSCGSGNCPPLNLKNNHTSAVITATAGSSTVLVGGSGLDPSSLCGAEDGIDPSQFSSTISVDTSVPYMLTLTLDKTLVNLISNNGAPFMGVCLQKPPQPPNGGSVLPDCFKGGVTSPPPCVVSRNKNKANEVIVISVPAGDPHFNIH